MKKFLFFTCFAVVMVGCEKKTTVNDSPDSPAKDSPGVVPQAGKRSPDCESDPLMAEIYDIVDNGTYQDALNWLSLHGNEICEKDLVECIEPMHLIKTDTAFNAMAKLHAENSVKIKKYGKKWSELDAFLNTIGCYDKYVGFSFPGGALSFKPVTGFTIDESCYSKPFFKGIQKKYNIMPTDSIKFVKTMGLDSHGTNVLKIIFEVQKRKTAPATGYDYYFYDFSQNPPLIEYK